MAYTVNASNSGLSSSVVPLSAMPMTMACWFNPTNTTAFARLMATCTAADGAHNALLIRGDVAGDPVQVNSDVAAAPGGAVANTTTSFSAGTWQHACGVFASSTSRTAYLNGGGSATNSTSKANSGYDRLCVGLFKGMGSTLYGNQACTIAECGWWNVALSASEIASLAKGMSPLLVRPDALVAYKPLGGIFGNNYNDIVAGGAMTSEGTVTKTDHPPKIIYPSWQRMVHSDASSFIDNTSPIYRHVLAGAL